jgi:uncharacterized membrane protein YecN with MAPEG domain
VITSIYAALIGLLIIILSLNVALRRMRTQIAIGTGDNDYLIRAIRAQANLIEYAPITLILLFLAELNGTSALMLNCYGITFIVARLFHALGLYLSSGPSWPRFIGVNLTWLVIFGLSVWNLIYGYQQLAY